MCFETQVTVLQVHRIRRPLFANQVTFYDQSNLPLTFTVKCIVCCDNKTCKLQLHTLRMSALDTFIVTATYVFTNWLEENT